MNKLIYLTFFFTLSFANAGTPTLESLLRNANNPDIEGRTVNAKLRISKTGSEIDTKDLNFLNQTEESEEKKITDDMTVRFIINNENEKYPRLTQIDYLGNTFSDSVMMSMKTRSFYNLKSLTPVEEKIEARLFYSTLSMLFNNNNTLFLDLLRYLGVKFKTNKELVNKEKIALLKEYTKYLQALKEKKSEDEQPLNPLKPEDLELRKNYAKIMKSPLIKEDGIVRRVKITDDFFYIVDLNNIYMKFDSDHKMKELKLKTQSGDISYSFGRYITSSGKSIFPETIYYKGLSGIDYEVKLERMWQKSDTSSERYKRLDYFKRALDKNKEIQPIIKPAFIL